MPPPFSFRRASMLNWLAALDAGILLWIQETVRLTGLNPIAAFYTHLGDAGLLWVGLSFVMLCFPKTRRAGLLSLLALALGGLLTNVLLKHLVGRTRPWLIVEGLLFLVEVGDPNSFPSGHTCAAFAAAGVWLRTLPRRWMKVTGIVMAVFMGLSRLYVGVHFPSDVLAGALVGLLCAQLGLYLGEHLPKLGKERDDRGGDGRSL